jgi:hypothetical protein
MGLRNQKDWSKAKAELNKDPCRQSFVPLFYFKFANRQPSPRRCRDLPKSLVLLGQLNLKLPSLPSASEAHTRLTPHLF